MDQTKRYRVVITEITDNVPYLDKEWVRMFDENTYLKLDPADRPKEQYGYRETEKVRTITLDIYNQALDTIDLPAVVAVLNGLDRK